MEKKPEKFTFLHGLLLAEFSALLIALATTVVPGKTGSKYGIAGWIHDRPSFLQEFAVNLVFVHAILILLAVGIAAWWWMTGSGRSSGPGD